jgi:hypothetical protein
MDWATEWHMVSAGFFLGRDCSTWKLVYAGERLTYTVAIGIYRPHDVRPILKAYEGKDIPHEYALKEAAEKQAVIEEWKARGGGKGLSGGGFTLSGLFGGKEQVRLVFLLLLLSLNLWRTGTGDAGDVSREKTT